MIINVLSDEKDRCKGLVDAQAVAIRQQYPADYAEKVRQAKAFLADPETPQPFIDLDAEVFGVSKKEAAEKILAKNFDVELERQRLTAKRRIDAASQPSEAKKILREFKNSSSSLIRDERS